MKPVVLHLIDSFRQGGSESQALNLYLEMMCSQEFDVKLACLDRSGPLLMRLPLEERLRIPEFKLNNFYDFRMVRQLFRFAGFLSALRVHVIHTHDFYTNVFGMFGAMLASVPVRVASRREESKRPRAKRFVERLAYRASSAVVANCDRIRDELIREGLNGRKVATVYNGVEVQAHEEPHLWHKGRCRRGSVVTIVANLRPVKDHVTFLKAASLIARTCPDTTFVLAGEGEAERSLRCLASQLGIAGKVNFLGRCDDVPTLLRQSDVCVLSSRSEGFPNAVLEYMAAARPVVATRVGGTHEAITDGVNGFLVAPGDYQEMADRVVLLLRHPLTAAEMGRRSHRLIVDRFSAGRRLQRMEQLYQQLVYKKAAAGVCDESSMFEPRVTTSNRVAAARRTRE